MLRVAAIQMTSTPDRSRNLAEAHRLLQEALERRVDLVAFPENFSLLPSSSRELLQGAETLKGPTVETLQEWAAEYDVWILGGSIPLKSKAHPRKITNTSLLITADGEIAARYDKIHLFDAKVAGDPETYRESRFTQAGKRVIAAETPWGDLGLSICYDLRFPELYRAQSARQVLAMFMPSAFTAVTGKAHWDVLTRARAIENQCYVVAPAQTGEPYPGRKTHGHTRIVNPWGRVIAERPAGPGIVWADLDPAEAERVRSELPALSHRVL